MPTPETTTVRDNPEKHRFEIDLGDGSFAVAEYRLHPGRIVLTHTEVPPAHEGRGLGTTLVKAALASARGLGLEVVPICPFVRAYMTKHPEEQDLLSDTWRAKPGETL